MSHQSGITANAELTEFFSQCKDGTYRLIQVKCINEELSLAKYENNAHGSWEENFDKLISPLLIDKEPCYILYRLDSQSMQGYDWLFITWIPNNSHVRLKMLYASTRATLKKVFGDSLISDEILGHSPEDLTFHGYGIHLQSKSAPKPLTANEREIEEIKKSEMRHTGLDSGQQTITGTEFALTPQAHEAVERFCSGHLDYVQFKLDIQKEQVAFSKSQPSPFAFAQLQAEFSMEEPLYHLFRYNHAYAGVDHIKSILFIYSYVGYKIPVKQRMLYSSCKSPFIQRLELMLGDRIGNKIELDATEEKLSEESLLKMLHPDEEKSVNIIDRPKAPGKRAPTRRLIE